MIIVLNIALLVVLCAGLWLMYQMIRRLSTLVDTLLDHQEMMKAYGIYTIVCQPADASYLGCTRVSFHSRWGQHISLLNRNRHENARLQQDWNSYGARAFQFIVLEIIEDTDRVEVRERELLTARALQLRPAQNYNLTNSTIRPLSAIPEYDPAPAQTNTPPKKRRAQREEKPWFGSKEAQAEALRVLDTGIELDEWMAYMDRWVAEREKPDENNTLPK